MSSTTTITIRLPITVHQQLLARADQQGKTVADFVRHSLAAGLETDADNQRLTQLERRVIQAVQIEGQQTRQLIDQLATTE